MKPYLLIAEFLKRFGREEGLQRFFESKDYPDVQRVSPDNAKSLCSLFWRLDELSTIELLSRIPRDGPGVSSEEISAIASPTLIIGSGEEYVHPLIYASSLRDLIPNSALQVVTSKTVDKALHHFQLREAIASFLAERVAAP